MALYVYCHLYYDYGDWSHHFGVGVCYVPPLPVVAQFPLLMFGCSAVCFHLLLCAGVICNEWAERHPLKSQALRAEGRLVFRLPRL